MYFPISNIRQSSQNKRTGSPLIFTRSTVNNSSIHTPNKPSPKLNVRWSSPLTEGDPDRIFTPSPFPIPTTPRYRYDTGGGGDGDGGDGSRKNGKNYGNSDKKPPLLVLPSLPSLPDIPNLQSQSSRLPEVNKDSTLLTKLTVLKQTLISNGLKLAEDFQDWLPKKDEKWITKLRNLVGVQIIHKKKGTDSDSEALFSSEDEEIDFEQERQFRKKSGGGNQRLTIKGSGKQFLFLFLAYLTLFGARSPLVQAFLLLNISVVVLTHIKYRFEYGNGRKKDRDRKRHDRFNKDPQEERGWRGKMAQMKLDERIVVRIAIVSRLIVLVIQVLSSLFLHPFRHENDGFKFTPEDGYGTEMDHIVNRTLGGFANWDGQYFLHIAVHGYTEERIMAFFPLFPLIFGSVARALHLFLGSFVSLSSLAIISGCALNAIFFVLAAKSIFKLARSLDIIDPWTAVMIFCYNPASIFFSSLYTESLFTLLTVNVLTSLHSGKPLNALVLASLSTLCRSNGILNFGFIGASFVHKALVHYKGRPTLLAIEIIRKAAFSAMFLFPFVGFQLYGISQFCPKENSVVRAPPYCKYETFPYAYIQKNYWDVGFLRYFEPKQIPNFLLAAPILYFQVFISFTDYKTFFEDFLIYNLRDSFDYYNIYVSLHGLLLAFFCFFFMHVQVSTRFILSSFPYFYVYLAEKCKQDLEKFRHHQMNFPILMGIVQIWCIGYFLAGAIAFPLGYPWT